MKKTPTIFERDWDGDRSKVLNSPHPDCDWVFAGEGKATRKLDGTCCMVRDGALYRRREVKKGKPDPAGFELAEHDEKTGKRIGWTQCDIGPEDRWHMEAFGDGDLEGGTYELLGPKIQGNPEGYPEHQLVNHHDASLVIEDVPRDFDMLREWMSSQDIEGIVFHHQDGRMAKIKLKDFGLKRPQKSK